MTWFTGILTLLKYLPDVVALCKELGQVIVSIEGYFEKKQKIGDITKALQLARTTGDTSGLEAIFRGAPVDAPPPGVGKLPDPANPKVGP